MTIRWPKHRATADAHTVFLKGGHVAGFLIRDSASRVELGYVWSFGTAWGWRAADGVHYGERATQSAAIEVLRDTFDAVHRAPYVRDRWARKPLLEVLDAETVDIVTDDVARHRMPVRRQPATAPTKKAIALPASTLTPTPTPPAPKVAQTIVWGAPTPGLTAAVSDALSKHKGGK